MLDYVQRTLPKKMLITCRNDSVKIEKIALLDPEPSHAQYAVLLFWIAFVCVAATKISVSAAAGLVATTVLAPWLARRVTRSVHIIAKGDLFVFRYLFLRRQLRKEDVERFVRSRSTLFFGEDAYEGFPPLGTDTLAYHGKGGTIDLIRLPNARLNEAAMDQLLGHLNRMLPARPKEPRFEQRRLKVQSESEPHSGR